MAEVPPMLTSTMTEIVAACGKVASDAEALERQITAACSYVRQAKMEDEYGDLFDRLRDGLLLVLHDLQNAGREVDGLRWMVTRS